MNIDPNYSEYGGMNVAWSVEVVGNDNNVILKDIHKYLDEGLKIIFITWAHYKTQFAHSFSGIYFLRSMRCTCKCHKVYDSGPKADADTEAAAVLRTE